MVLSSVAFKGIEAIPVEVQVSLVSGLPSFVIVGLPDKVVAESRERVKSAINSLGLALPLKKIIVNLSPADLAKEGSHYDLPIAIGVLVEMGVLENRHFERTIVMGELSLHGHINGVRGVLSTAHMAKNMQYKLICPWDNGGEAALIQDVSMLAPNNLLQLINYFRHDQPIPSLTHIKKDEEHVAENSLSNIRGHVFAKRAAEIAVAGKHNLLMIGPPGSGKSMLARCMASLLPPMSYQEALEVSMIKSVAGEWESFGLKRPYRAPHHSCSTAAMIGGGRKANPGEISLAHNGVLFLDELPEFSRATLEGLRQPMENKTVTISRAESHITYPANFQLVAAMNPCRCGYANTLNAVCSNYIQCVISYTQKISGPMMDRMDIIITMEPIDILDFEEKPDNNEEKNRKERILGARSLQAERFREYKINYNSEASWEMIQKYAMPEKESDINLVREINKKNNLSNRVVGKIFQIARTVADLAGSEKVCSNHLAEAIMLCNRAPNKNKIEQTS